METGTQTPVDALSGRELDAAVAREVLGKYGVKVRDGEATHVEEHRGYRVQLPRYSAGGIAAAWEVKASLESRGLGVTIIGPKGVFGGTFRDDDRTGVVLSVPKGDGGRTAMQTVRADTAPLAICRAALKAVRSA